MDTQNTKGPNKSGASSATSRQDTGSNVQNIGGSNSPMLTKKRYDLSVDHENISLSKRLCEIASSKNAELEVVISIAEFSQDASMLWGKLSSIEGSFKIVFKLDKLEKLQFLNQSGLTTSFNKAHIFLLNHTQEFDLSKIEINNDNHEDINSFLKNLSELKFFTKSLQVLKFGDVKLDKNPFIVSNLDIIALEFQNVSAQLEISNMEFLKTLSVGDLKTQSISFKGLYSLERIRIGNIEGTFELPYMSVTKLKELTIGDISGICRLPDSLDYLECLSVGDICAKEFTLSKSLKNLKTFVLGSCKNGGSQSRSMHKTGPELVIEFPKALDCLESLIMGPIMSNWCEIRISQFLPNLKNLTLDLSGFHTCFKFPERSLYNLKNLKLLEGGKSGEDLKKWDKLLTSLENLTTLETTWMSDFLKIAESNSLNNLRTLIVDCVLSPTDLKEIYRPLNNFETIIIRRLQCDGGKTHTFQLSSLSISTLVIDEINNLSAKTYVRNNHKNNITLKLFLPSETCTNITFKRIGVGINLEFPESLDSLENLNFGHIRDNCTIDLPSSMAKLRSFQYAKDDRDFREQLPLLFLKYKVMLLRNIPASICGVIFFLLLAWRFLF